MLPLINNKFPFSVDELEMFDKLSCFPHISTWFVFCCRVEFRQFIVFLFTEITLGEHFASVQAVIDLRDIKRLNSVRLPFVICCAYIFTVASVPCWFHFKPESGMYRSSVCLFIQAARNVEEKTDIQRRISRRSDFNFNDSKFFPSGSLRAEA